MRTLITLSLGGCASIASAQLVNGSFEDGWNNWIPAPFATAISLDAAPDQGSSCLELASAQWSPSTVFQALPDLSQGEVIRFGGWVKEVNSWYLEPPRVGICICNSASITVPLETSLTWTGPEWAYLEDTIQLTTPLPPGHFYGLFVSGTLTPASTILYTRFDGLFAEPMIVMNAVALPGAQGVAAFPNPATDKLWIDLPESPLSITAIDACGRTHDLKNFTHRERTSELDVDALPPGICLLRVTTAPGTHTVRFVKA